jgi:hypothetical protein
MSFRNKATRTFMNLDNSTSTAPLAANKSDSLTNGFGSNTNK